MPSQDNSLFEDKNIQRFDSDTIKNRYGNNWRNFASNVREITQPDGSIIKEYIIEDPTLLEEIKSSPGPTDSALSTTISDDEQQRQSLKNKFAQIKANFEQKTISNVMGSPLTASTHSSNTTARENLRKQTDELYARHRRASNESIPIQTINFDNNNSIRTPNQSINTHDSYQRSQSIATEKSKTNSLRRLESADEADEEVRRIHRQGEEIRRHKEQFTPILSTNEISHQPRVQYEILDEDGNLLNIDGVQDLIKMSGVHAREVPQLDGTIIKEYVIDDPGLLSKYHSQQQKSSITSSYHQHQINSEEPPPPPPRMPLRSSILFRQGTSSINDNLSHNIQQIHVLEPQRRYEYLTRTGRRVQFLITNSNSFNRQLINDGDIRELTHAINSRLAPSSTTIVQHQHQEQEQNQQQLSSTQTSFNLPKHWNPSVDFTQRKRIGSDTQLYSENANNDVRHISTDIPRSISHVGLNQGSYISQKHQQVSNEPVNNWNTYRYQDPHSEINNQHYQNNETFQTSSQFLPSQPITRSMHSPPINTNHMQVSHQQSIAYPYQGQQQHGVRILNDFNQQRTPIIFDQHNRIST
ncbi:unnamed protein product [Rotaria socialis]|uniref:Uncharacterized protein n=1 Tax=Rotaria socialis TaxID=392032 RepID=A0A820UF33_9BILA|nr:unnamed protein product [Rotaria socialis]CAF4481699.1 unnamed protein product [Rotaria socialis]